MEVGGYVGHRIPHFIASALRSILRYDGDIAAGETVTIDTDQLLVTKDGTNTRPSFNLIKDWLQLDPGETVKLVYQDSETSRTIELEIVKEDRHI